MKSNRFIIAALSAVALFALCMAAQSQTLNVPFGPSILIAGGTNMVTAGATSNYTASVSVERANYVGLQVSFKLDGAGTEGCVFKFSKSVDGTTYETTPSLLWTNSANGTTAVAAFYQWQVSGAKRIKLATIINGSSGQQMTNVTVKVGVKQ